MSIFTRPALRFILPIVLCLILHTAAFAQQYQGIRLNLSVEKEIKLSKKTRLQLEQQLQLTPELGRKTFFRTRDLDFGEIDFLDDDFLPRGNGYDGRDDDDDDDDDGIADNDDTDDDNDGISDDDDDDDDDNTGTPPTGSMPGAGNGSGTEQVPFDRWDYRLGIRSATTAAFQWEFYKNFRFVSGYVFNIRPGNNTHRLFMDVVYNRRFMDKKLGFNSRLRLLNEAGRNKKNKFVVETFATIGSQVRWRTRLSPFVGGDLVYDFDEKKFNRFRYNAGVDYELTEKQQLSLALNFQRRINVAKPDASFVVSLGYALML